MSKELLKFLKGLHWDLWDWQSKNPLSHKESWPGWEFVPHVPNGCFLCLVDRSKGGTSIECSTGCDHCPGAPNVPAVYQNSRGTCLKGLYHFFLMAQANMLSLEATEYARAIRDLKWEGVDND